VRRLFSHAVGPLHRSADGANPNRKDPTEASMSALWSGDSAQPRL